MGIRQDEDRLFVEWRQAVEARGDAPFVPDGVVCERTWRSQRTKLLFALKEPNTAWTREPVDIRTYAARHPGANTWNNIARWTASATALRGEPPPWDQLKNMNKGRRQAALQKIAAINLKKAGGGPRAEEDSIREAVVVDRERIVQQIGLYEPNRRLIIICCGTFAWLSDVLGLDETRSTSRGIRYGTVATGANVMEFWHPQCRFPARLLCYAFADAVREIMLH